MYNQYINSVSAIRMTEILVKDDQDGFWVMLLAWR